jgi:Carboxypeptidase regulatory-like domain/TonB dependent receptor
MNSQMSFNMLTRLLISSLLLLAVVMIPQSSRAQVLYGSIVGNVKDANGAVIPNAQVTITNKETAQSRETRTDESGSYAFSTIQPGVYDLKVTHSGFKTFTRLGLTITLNNVTRIDSVLEPGDVTEVVQVSADSPLLQTERAEVRAELGERTLKELPVPLGRNYQNLFKTLPGFTPPADAHSVPTNPSRSLRFNVNGVSASINNTRIDGASTTNPWLPHITAYVPSLEAIETVNVVSNSFDAEQGLAGGAAINVQLKSGTNDFHGSAFWYHNNQHLNARNFFLPPTAEKGLFVFNQYGATFGGPIKKDKLFFFGSYEGTNDRRSANRTGSVPTEALRSGNFANANTTIYDPTTGDQRGLGRTPFQNNQIPQERWDPVARMLLQRLPLPNLNQRPDGTYPEANNYFAQAPFIFDRWTVDSKVNWNVTEKASVFGRFSILDFATRNGTLFGTALEGPPIANFSNAGMGGGNTYNFSIGGNFLLTPNVVLDANFGWVRLITNSEHPSIGQNIGLDLLGIPGTNGPENYQSGWPRFDFGYSALGTEENFMPYYRNDENYQYVANVTWMKGKHEIRAGLDFYQMNMNHLQPEFPLGDSRGARGRFEFGAGVTGACLALDSAGRCSQTSATNVANRFAAFLLGLPSTVGKMMLAEAEPYSTRNWSYSLYVRDRWQVTPKLSLSYGTRWEYFPIPTRADRGLERYDPAINKMLIGGIVQVPKDLGVKISKTQFAPRVGLAYRITEDFVMRAGYGITNDPYPLSRPLRTNHPILIELTNQGANTFQPASELAAGIPPIQVPDLGFGIIDIPRNITAITLPNEFNRGYVQSWNLTLQKNLKWGFVGEAGYVASRTIRQLGFLELNWSPIGGGSAGQQLFRSFGRTASTRLASPVGGSHFDSLQTRLQRRFANGVQMEVSYTLSKSIGLPVTSGGSDEIAPVQIPEFYYLNRGLTNIDRTHNLQITSLMELPFGKGKRWANSGVLAGILGGWQINNLVSFNSGAPFSTTAAGTSLNSPNTTQRPDLVKPEVEILGVGIGQPYFDTTAFADVNVARLGTAGPNILRGPNIFSWDLGLFREFRVREKASIQFRAEAFNFTNTPRFEIPIEDNRNISNPGFGQITSSLGERIFRFGLRVGF